MLEACPINYFGQSLQIFAIQNNIKFPMVPSFMVSDPERVGQNCPGWGRARFGSKYRSDIGDQFGAAIEAFPIAL